MKELRWEEADRDDIVRTQILILNGTCEDVDGVKELSQLSDSSVTIFILIGSFL